MSQPLPGEDAAVANVLEIARRYGYGNLIAYLKREWAERLVDQGLSHESAVKAADVDGYPIRIPQSK